MINLVEPLDFITGDSPSFTASSLKTSDTGVELMWLTGDSLTHQNRSAEVGNVVILDVETNDIVDHPLDYGGKFGLLWSSKTSMSTMLTHL